LLSRPVPGQEVLEFAAHCVADLIDNRGMDLPKRRQYKAFCAKLTEKKVPVLLDPNLRFTLRESQIEAGRRTATHPTTPSTKGVDQPGITREERVLDPGQLASRDEM